MSGNPGGLYVHRGSRTENLADQLARRLAAQRPANPLAAQTVLVAHPGLKAWLLQRFARRTEAGHGHGIAANYDMILPWQWYERVARRLLGSEALIGGAWRHDVLRWYLLGALSQFQAPELTAYLAGEDAQRRRFQLAEHLAALYTQYLIYRPDWILAWEQSSPRPGEDWQIALWRQLAQAIARPHRARRGSALLDALARTTPDGANETLPLHVFGVSHLPPDLLVALQAQAQQREVHLYFPDPCREHWVYLRSKRYLLAHADDPAALYFELGHPLLVTLGRVAQDFCLSLDECDAIDERDAEDEAETAKDEAPLLARLQSSIRCMEPDQVGAPIVAALDAGQDRATLLLALRADASLRVHLCHTRLRELEVLKNALLRCLADDPGLQHRDIVVMAPDIAAYAPYLPAVFGAPAQYRDEPLHIPWHVADVGLARAHPLISAFGHLLELAESRFTVSEVMDLLDVPALARRFMLDAGSREALERWLQSSHVAWGLDAAMKAASGAAAVDENSWQFGLDRMYAGLLSGQDDDGSVLIDGILPLPGVSGNAVEALGQLDRLLEELRRWRAAAAAVRPLPAWSQWLLERLEAIFQPDPRDDAELAALDSLRRLVAALGQQADEAKLAQPLPWSVVREALRNALEQVPERQPFLLGGVTFCGLVPQRSIPFRVVCLLGMNEGEFPRQGSDAGLNRITAQPRRGDRDTRSEDRYLFLEALMSARETLHISYIGEGVRDGKPRNPAAPLAELLQFLDEQYRFDEGTESSPPWLLRHPLQPFDTRYYERDAQGQLLHDPRLFSYDRHWLMREHERPTPPSPVAASAQPETDGGLALAALKRFWRDPARYQLLRERGISLESQDAARWPDREPLQPAIDRRLRVEHRLLFDALDSGQPLPTEAPAWLDGSGALAAGMIGARAYAAAQQPLQDLLQAARERFGSARIERTAQAIELTLELTPDNPTPGSTVRLHGTVDDVFRSDDGRRWLFGVRPNGAAGFRDLLPFYIDWAVLRLTLGEAIEGCLLEHPGKSPQMPPPLAAILAQDPSQLRTGLRQLIALAADSATQPLLFFPRTAWAWLNGGDDKARRVWEGDDFNQVGERDYAPGYAELLTRGIDLFDTAAAAHASFTATARQLLAVLDPGATGTAI